MPGSRAGQGRIRDVLKPAVRWTVRSPAFSAFVGLVEAATRGAQGLLYVLTYHRVDEPGRDPDLDPHLISATPREFERQVSMLSEACRVVGTDDVLRALDGGAPLPARAVLVTFDDGYEDFETYAWPILRRHGVPATLFVPTDYPAPGAPEFWWDRLHRAIRRAEPQASVDLPGRRIPLSNPRLRTAAFREVSAHLQALPPAEAASEIDRIGRALACLPAPGRVLGWDALRRLASQGLAVAPHGRTHALMSRMSPDEAAGEAVSSLRDLEREIGPTLPCFAYPAGAWCEGLPSRLERDGFRAAFTTRRGVNVISSCDPLLLRRINVGRTTSPALLRAQLLPWVRLLNRLRPLAARGETARRPARGLERRG